MKFVWAGDREKINSRVVFSLKLNQPCDRMILCAADFYQIYIDDIFHSYGPERTAAGYSRKREIVLSNCSEIKIYVQGYNITCYACDKQLPFFGAILYNGEKEIYTSHDFIAYEESSRLDDMPKFSTQRGYIESYDFNIKGVNSLLTYSVPAPKILGGIGDSADYRTINFDYVSTSNFLGFDEVKPLYWMRYPRNAVKPGQLDVDKDIIPYLSSGQFESRDYILKSEHTGFIKLEINAKEKSEIYVVFDEIKPDGRWVFRRDSCNDLLKIVVDVGERSFISAEPYAIRYLKLLVKGDVDITPTLIAYDYSRANYVSVTGDEKFVKVFDAALRTFRQNSVDLFMDCPGRERAGWLCDSYFTAIAERLFTGDNKIEQCFLENFIIAETPDVPEGMLPKCFPSEHTDFLYIPNWAMWFVLEIKSYLDRTGDYSLVERAKEKIYGIINFFKKYINEFGLLEDLQSWVFIEWSVCNERLHLKGVNFPSNMLYAYMLEIAGELYDDKKLIEQAQKIKKVIVELSYDGTFFADNSIREDGKLVRCNEHLSETCQYYALFTGICPDENFKNRLKDSFGPLRDNEVYSEVGHSNMFIGYYLRLFWLCELGEYEKVIDECLEYFYKMAEETGTLWEKNTPVSSCNHGFASVAAVILLKCICGYETVVEGKPIFKKNFKKSNKYDVNVKFNYLEK